jgi:hypothetical protein
MEKKLLEIANCRPNGVFSVCAKGNFMKGQKKIQNSLCNSAIPGFLMS